MPFLLTMVPLQRHTLCALRSSMRRDQPAKQDAENGRAHASGHPAARLQQPILLYARSVRYGAHVIHAVSTAADATDAAVTPTICLPCSGTGPGELHSCSSGAATRC
jgi:hypothetical protein